MIKDKGYEEIARKKLEYFYQNKIRVHLKLYNGTFYNGLVFDYKKDFIILHDRKVGRVPVFFIEIKFVDEFREREEE